MEKKENQIKIDSYEKIATELNKRLGPEYISYRIGFGNIQIAYLEGWAAINIANRIFGYNGWSSEVKQISIDYIDEINGRYNIGVSALIKVILRDGTQREDIGFGSAENQKMKNLALEKAKKEATTDGLKRALRQFGNALGNCCYDKEFLREIKKIKKQGNEKLCEFNLFRKFEADISNLSCIDDELDGIFD